MIERKLRMYFIAYNLIRSVLQTAPSPTMSLPTDPPGYDQENKRYAFLTPKGM